MNTKLQSGGLDMCEEVESDDHEEAVSADTGMTADDEAEIDKFLEDDEFEEDS